MCPCEKAECLLYAGCNLRDFPRFWVDENGPFSHTDLETSTGKRQDWRCDEILFAFIHVPLNERCAFRDG